MVAAEPAFQILMRARLACLADLVRTGMIERELHDQPIGVGDIHRAAIAVLEYVGLRFLVSGHFQSLLNALLRLLVNVQSNVVKRRVRHFGSELLLILELGKFKERQGAAISERKEKVTIHALRSKQFVDLAPGRDQGQPDDILVEFPRSFQVIGHVGVVMQTGRKLLDLGHGRLQYDNSTCGSFMPSSPWRQVLSLERKPAGAAPSYWTAFAPCLLYTSDAAD